MLVRIVGLGPGDPALLTIGTLGALRDAGRAIALCAPPALLEYLAAQGVEIDKVYAVEQAAVVRGSIEAIADLVERIDDDLSGRDLTIGVIGNPLSDFPGLPLFLHALEALDIPTQIVPGMPRATLAAPLSIPLLPLPIGASHFSFEALVEIMGRLRLGCPWDKEQTHRTLMPYLLEETYEVVEAIEADDLDSLCEELGDLLLQIVFHAQLGSEVGAFTIADVIDALSNKMVRRHPHVFGDANIPDVDAQWKSWEQLKSKEKTGLKRASRLDGIPKHLGALQRGQRMQEKAARVGFDWPDVSGVLDKIHEEMTELAAARREKNDDAHVREELGDVFFTLVNLSRALGIDAEGAVREANEKFYRRFSFMERAALQDGKALSNLTLDEFEELWQRAKTQPA